MHSPLIEEMDGQEEEVKQDGYEEYKLSPMRQPNLEETGAMGSENVGNASMSSILGAISELTNQVKSLTATTVTKSDIERMQDNLIAETKGFVKTAVTESMEPVKGEIDDLKRRITDLEAKLAPGSRASSVSGESRDPDIKLRLID